MRVVVVGAGALGGFLGARLSRAGHRVDLLCRGDRLSALRRSPLRLRSEENGLETTVSMEAGDDPHGLGPVDAVLLTVRSWDLDAALDSVSLLIDDDTAVVTFQPGLSTHRRVAQAVGRERVAFGSTWSDLHSPSPDLIVARGLAGSVELAESSGGASRRLERLAGAFRHAGQEAEVVADGVESFRQKRWVLECALGGAAVLARAGIGEVLGQSRHLRFFRRLLRETAGLLWGGTSEETASRCRELERFARERLPERFRPCLFADLENRRRPELEVLTGEALRLGRRWGLSTPANEAVYRALVPYAVRRC